MTRLIIETDNTWAIEKIHRAISAEISLLKKAVERTKNKLKDFESRYGSIDNRGSLYGKIDDMELIEWEGEVETLQKFQQKLKSLEEMTLEYK